MPSREAPASVAADQQSTAKAVIDELTKPSHEDQWRGEGSDRRFRIRYLNAAATSEDLTDTDCRVLLCLVLKADSDGGNCFWSARALAEELNRSHQQVRTVLRRLEKTGWLRRVPFVATNGRQTSNLYLFTIPKNARIPGNELLSRQDRQGAQHWNNMLGSVPRYGIDAVGKLNTPQPRNLSGAKGIPRRR